MQYTDAVNRAFEDWGNYFKTAKGGSTTPWASGSLYMDPSKSGASFTNPQGTYFLNPNPTLNDLQAMYRLPGVKEQWNTQYGENFLDFPYMMGGQTNSSPQVTVDPIENAFNQVANNQVTPQSNTWNPATGQPWSPLTIESGGGNIFDNMWNSGGTKSIVNQLPNWTPEQQALFGGLINLAKTAQPVYSDDLFAERNPYELNYFNYASGVPSTISALQAALQNSFKPAYDIDPAATEAYWNDSVLPGLMKTFNEKVLPGFREQFAGPQWWSQNRATQTENLFEDLNTQLSTQYADLKYKDELARREALEKAMGRVAAGASTSGNLAGVGSDILSKVGSTQRTIDQEKIAGQLQKWLMGGSDSSGQTNTLGNANVSLAMNLLGISPFTYQTTEQTTPAGVGASILTGAAGGTGSALMSKLLPLIQQYGGQAIDYLGDIDWTSLFGGE